MLEHLNMSSIIESEKGIFSDLKVNFVKVNVSECMWIVDGPL